MNIYEKLMAIQSRLKAPKNQYNSFGKYKYRNLEDILEAVKPLLSELKAVLTITDEPVVIGDRVYIKSEAVLIDAENPAEQCKNTAYAREALEKKGMDTSQVTGATSSYARKYCLNGLFCIDDNKDADNNPPVNDPKPITKITEAQAKELSDLINQTGTDQQAFLRYAKAQRVQDIQVSQYGSLKSMLLAKIQKGAA